MRHLRFAAILMEAVTFAPDSATQPVDKVERLPAKADGRGADR